jgi:alanine racemase
MSTPAMTRVPIEERLAAAGLPPLPRLAWLEIDVDALAWNLRLIRLTAGDVAVFAVVKADAYGHGAEQAARAFVDAGAGRLCVATFDEAVQLRDAGITAPIVVLYRVPGEVVAQAAELGIELTVSEQESVAETAARWREEHALAAAAGAYISLHLHIEVETGLGRAGLPPQLVAAAIAELGPLPGIGIAGLWTHFASAGDAQASAAQVALFESTFASIVDAGLPMPPRHAAASGGVFAATAPSYEAVRPGLSLYGLLPDDLVPAPDRSEAAAGLRPAMQLKARPLRVESVGVGGGVSYGSRWRATRPSLIATLPVGYADGITRASWPGEEVLVNGRRAPLVGTVAMDAVMVDVTDVPGVGMASEFTLLGVDDGQAITAYDLARLRNTISWEVLATMARRLPRVYHAGPVLVGRRTLTGDRTE